ncbi:MAG: DNA internalization-related competence protein ComEC/Rec2 [Dehalococcoidales bacterium]|nr:DNA internalization-related competence protein ComEC/Rec2 [Dehalococcoidales bacterium]
MTLIYLSLSWIAGILIGFKFNLPAVLIITGFLPFLFLLSKSYRKKIVLSGICIFAFFGGTVCAHASLPGVDSVYISFYNDTGTVTITGMISDDPDVRDSSTQLRVTVSQIKMDKDWYTVRGDVLVFVPRYPSYCYGDIIEITGKPSTPPEFEGFNYAEYLSHENIYSTILYPKIKIIETGRGLVPLSWLYSLRSQLSLSLARILPEPQASLAQGMLLGIRGNIPEDLKQAFSVTGTAHLLAISGLHLGIIAGIMLSIGLWLFGRKHYIYVWLALGFIWMYAILTGMNAPVVRGTIMASIFLTAELLGRQRSAITALTFAAAIMVGLDPQVIFTASFQMSFMAMAGLIFLFPPLQAAGRNLVNITASKYETVVPAAYFIADGFGVTLAALLAVWPLVAYYFGIISFIGPLATFLALPVLAGIIVLGSLTAITGLFFLPAAQIIGWLLWLFLSYLLTVVNGFASLSISYVDVGAFSVTLILIYYIALAFLLWLGHRYRWLNKFADKNSGDAAKTITKPVKKGKDNFFLRRPVKWAILSITVLIILGVMSVNIAPDDRLHVIFLDAGQGDAILIQKGNLQILIDGGPGSQAISLAISKEMPFWDRTIEMVILTHPHDDHLTGLVEVLNEYKVEQILTTDLVSDTPVYEEWLRLIEENDINFTAAQAGQRIIMNEVTIDILNPQPASFTGTESDYDNNCIVLHVSMQHISFLLTGDLRWEGEFELITQRLVSKTTVLKIGHHGSNTSSTLEFLNVVNPQTSVISVGQDNNYGHPDNEVIGRLTEMIGAERIYRTDRDGTIEFITDGHKLWLETEK